MIGRMRPALLIAAALILQILAPACKPTKTGEPALKPEFTLNADKTHNRFSAAIPPVLTVQSGTVIEVYTKEATDGQITPNSTAADVGRLDFNPIHPLTGPVSVEDAQPGDMIAVKLLKIEPENWGWASIVPGFGFLADEFTEPYLKIFHWQKGARRAQFNEKISVPLRPFAGVMGVAPATDSMLTTIPPRANGGNMDNPFLTEGVTVYFPVFVAGGLFSIGDTHAAQGMGEVCGTAIESPMRIVYQIFVLKGEREIAEPQYESDDFYAVTASSPTLEEAARKATRYMIDYLEAEHGLTRSDAYVLCSLAGELRITEVVDMPNVHVVMHMPKRVLGM